MTIQVLVNNNVYRIIARSISSNFLSFDLKNELKTTQEVKGVCLLPSILGVRADAHVLQSVAIKIDEAEEQCILTGHADRMFLPGYVGAGVGPGILQPEAAAAGPIVALGYNHIAIAIPADRLEVTRWDLEAFLKDQKELAQRFGCAE